MTRNKMTCCYFPTTTVLIDDDLKFLKLASMKVSRFAPTKLFNHPVSALEYINHDYNRRPFFNQFFSKPIYDNHPSDHSRISVDYTKIYKQIYDPKRFAEITGLLVDYAMPGINGRDFCSIALSSCDWRSWDNIILLTGEAKVESATDMIKDRLISAYIRKGDDNYLEQLVRVLKNRQIEYFEKHSQLFINLIADSAELSGLKPSCFRDPVYVDFFYRMIELYKPTEYYLIDQSGSYIFLNDEGKISWLIVQSEDDMATAEFEMAQEDAPAKLLKEVVARKALRYSFKQAPFSAPLNTQDWEKIIYPAEKLSGISNYYYSYIEEPLVETFIDQDKIGTYMQFRESLIA